MRIRAATPDDARAIATIRVSGWRWAYRGQLSDELLDGLSIDRDEERWRAGLLELSGDREVLVAEDDGGVVGFTSHGRSRDPGEAPDVAEVYAIYVHPDRVREGVGRAMMTAALDALERMGFRQATLWVLETNERAQAFYASMGFRPDGASKRDELSRFEVAETRLRRALS